MEYPEPYTTTFPDGGVFARVSDTTITYTGPRGSHRWEWRTPIECSAAWLAVCTH